MDTTASLDAALLVRGEDAVSLAQGFSFPFPLIQIQHSDEYTAHPGKLKASSKEAIERHIRTTFAGIKGKPITAVPRARPHASDKKAHAPCRNWSVYFRHNS
jgi:hypothetical protein